MDFLESAVNYLNFHELGSTGKPKLIVADALTSIAYSLAGILEAMTTCPACEAEANGMDFESGWEGDYE